LETNFLQKQALEKEKEDLESLCQNVKSKLKQLTKDKEEQVRSAANYSEKFEAYKQSCQELESTKCEIEKENELLLLQLHQVQEELEDYFLRNQNLKQSQERLENEQRQSIKAKQKLSEELSLLKERLDAKEFEIKKQHQRVARLKKTLSWKATAPLRFIFKPLSSLSKEEKKIKKEIKVIQSSGYFDEAYYRSENEDVENEWKDPIEHFVRYGAAEGRNPSANFNIEQYLEANPDVAESGMNPFVHFIKYGIAERRVVSIGE